MVNKLFNMLIIFYLITLIDLINGGYNDVVSKWIQHDWKIELLQHLDSYKNSLTPTNSPTIYPTISPPFIQFTSIDYVDRALLNMDWNKSYNHRLLAEAEESDSELNINEISNNKKHNNYLSSVEGFYKGEYIHYDKKNNNAKQTGKSILIINHINSINIVDYYDKISSSNSSNLIVSSSTYSSTKLMFLNMDYKRYLFAFYYGIYDKYNGIILLSSSNFSYNLLYNNISFYSNSLSKSAKSVKSNNNVSCPELLIINITSFTGNFTSCSYNITLSSLYFINRSSFMHQANGYGIVSLICVSLIFFYLFKQYEYSLEMGRIIKISFITLYLQFIYNGTICFLHFDVAMNVESLFTTFLVISFICVMNANLYQRMMTIIWRLRHNINVNNINNSTHNLLKIYNFIKILSFIIILFLSSYIIISDYSFYAYLVLLSDWLFQIIHNIRTGHILSWKFNVVIMNTCGKLFYPLYIYGCPSNIIQNDTNYTFCVVIVGWQIIQISILYSMDFKQNSRWFLPKYIKPNQYKYHRTPTEDDDEEYDDDLESESDDDHDDDDNDTISITILDNKDTIKRRKNTLKTCAICLEDINWKKEYETIMVTPCMHYFHDDCLQTWIAQRLTCPTCRKQLPPPN